MKKLDFEYVKKYFEEHNCQLLETEYENRYKKMNFIFKNKLSYNGLEIIMWTVTWYYIAMNNYKNILKEDKINNKIKK